ncbi:MAG: hypothetical protein D6726_12940 [Nitrospirae bacterium]|nr:MAG: hypothetical protein D6726_12940 [Nitrospirota bacterium]
MIKVGYIVPFLVVKALPDYDSYFCNILGTELYALLPHKYAHEKYQVGGRGWAAIFKMEPPKIILSQKSPQFIRKIIESKCHEVLITNDLKVKRVARISGSDFCKVAIGANSTNGKVLSSRDLYELFRGYKDELGEYIKGNIHFVKHSPKIEEYALNALAPAPIERVKRVIHYQSMNSVEIVVDKGDAGLFFGKKKANVITAKKLTGVEIEITPV